MSVEIRKYVHVFMWNADDVDTVGNAKIEHEVLAFRKTMVSLGNISTMHTIIGIFSQPIKTSIQVFQLHIALGFAPMLLSVTTDIFQVIFCTPCDSVFCHQASLSRSLISVSIEKSLTKSPATACFAP